MLNFFRRDARLALPLTKTPRPALEDAKEAPNRTRTSFVLPVVAVSIVAIVLVAEKLTGRLASLLGHERYSRDTLPGGACLIGPRQIRQPLRKAPGGPAPTDRYNMVAGKCHHCHCRPQTQLLSSTRRIHNLRRCNRNLASLSHLLSLGHGRFIYGTRCRALKSSCSFSCFISACTIAVGPLGRTGWTGCLDAIMRYVSCCK